MKKQPYFINGLSVLFTAALIAIAFIACSNSDDTDTTDASTTNTAGLHRAFAEFDTDNTDIYLDGTNVVIETNGLPNHTTVYWGEGHELFIEEPEVNRTPSIIPNFDGSNTLRVPVDPQLAANSTATNMGAIGISVSGAAIFNDQEGSGPLSGAIVSLDYTGGHIGPAEYHYHLEPTAISFNDDKLIGIIADGFFVYGRKCFSTGDYPQDLDASGGHTHVTQHSDEEEYHYHIQNEPYLNEYYIIFPGNYQGTPNSIN